MNWSEIIAAFLNAAGVIIAAIIGVGLLDRSIKRNFTSSLYSYSDKGRNAKQIMRGATHDIYIVANCGNNLLDEYQNFLCMLLKSGITLNILILEKTGYVTMDSYVSNGVSKSTASHKAMYDSLQHLAEMQSFGYDNLHIRTFPLIFTASYIGVDIEVDPITARYQESSVLQTMFYQYLVAPKDSPTVCYTVKSNPTYFKRTIESIMQMWDDATERPDISEYLNQYKNNIDMK